MNDKQENDNVAINQLLNDVIIDFELFWFLEKWSLWPRLMDIFHHFVPFWTIAHPKLCELPKLAKRNTYQTKFGVYCNIRINRDT